MLRTASMIPSFYTRTPSSLSRSPLFFRLINSHRPISNRSSSAILSHSTRFSNDQHKSGSSQFVIRKHKFHSSPPWRAWDWGILKKFSGEDDDKKKDPFKDQTKGPQTPQDSKTPAGSPSEELPNDWDGIARQSDKLERKFQETQGFSKADGISKFMPQGTFSVVELFAGIDDTPFAEIKRAQDSQRKEKKFAKIVETARQEKGVNTFGAWDVATDPELNPNLIQQITYPEIEEPFDLEDPVFLTPYHDMHPTNQNYPTIAGWNPFEYHNYVEGRKVLDQTPYIYDEDYEDLPLPAPWVALLTTLPFQSMRPHQWRPWKPYVRDEDEQKIYNRLKESFPLAKRRAFLEASIVLDVRKWPHIETPGYEISIISPAFRDLSGAQANALVSDCIREFLQENDLLFIRAIPPYYDSLERFDITPNGWQSLLDDMETWDTAEPTSTLFHKLITTSEEIRGLTSTTTLPVVGARTIRQSRKSLAELPADVKTAFSLPPEEQKTLFDGIEPPEITPEIIADHQKKMRYLKAQREMQEHIGRQQKLDLLRIRREQEAKAQASVDGKPENPITNPDDCRIFDSGKRFAWLSDSDLEAYRKILADNPFLKEREPRDKPIKEMRKERRQEEDQRRKELDAKIQSLKELAKQV